MSREEPLREVTIRPVSPYMQADEAAGYLCLGTFRELRRYVAAGSLKVYRRRGSNRPLYKRTEVEALIEPVPVK